MSFEDLEREFHMRRRGRRKEIAVVALLVLAVVTVVGYGVWRFWLAKA